jgi:hypothetical protein
MRKQFYEGHPPETGGTAITGREVKAIRDLVNIGVIQAGMKVLDFGAGKGRNAEYLREVGCNVYAYDKFNGYDVRGWDGISSKKPTGRFDLAFTSYVLNVVPKHIECEIIEDLKKNSSTIYHVTRNMDIFDMVWRGLARRDRTFGDFFCEEFANSEQVEAYESGGLSKETVMDFCRFGVKTSKGFQRIPNPDGYTQIKKTSGYMVFATGV